MTRTKTDEAPVTDPVPPPPPSITDILPLPEDLDTLPEPDPFYFVVSKSQSWVFKKTMFGKALVPVDEIPHLDKTGAVLWHDIPKVPVALINQVWSFFRMVWNTKKTEAMVYLTWHPEHGYRVYVPNQSPTGGHVRVDNFDATPIKRGWRIAGTIHSHCNFGYFHSGTDTADADKHDGIHMTMGFVDDAKKFGIATMIAINGVKWNFEMPHVIDGQPSLGDKEVLHPLWWHRHMLDRVETPRAVQTSWQPQPPKPHVVNGGYQNRGASGHNYGRSNQGKDNAPAQTDTSAATNARDVSRNFDDDDAWFWRGHAGAGVHIKSSDKKMWGNTPTDPYLASTPLKAIDLEHPDDVVSVLIARGFGIPELLDDSEALALDDWDMLVRDSHNELTQVQAAFEELGIDVRVSFGVAPELLIRPNPPKPKGHH